MNRTTAVCWMVILLVATFCENGTCKGGRGGARGSARGSSRGRLRVPRVRVSHPSRYGSYSSKARVAVAGAAAGAAAGLAVGYAAGRLRGSRLIWDEDAQSYVNMSCVPVKNCTSDGGVYSYRAWTSSASSFWPSYSLSSICSVLTFKYVQP
ncbi:shadow of prion protein [Chiloscyllium plagiosum]|uniref:shadow of prion protein n=1 Tax=Chiloscyllium plagiosum TaxID=36176 RepID=UPI001CB82DC8|nr:shadow of prion protein [Chiloscyllium plagiosum]XP_043534802.1 shadow of prion protein [Chiloscyllium plagiosum]XP_043534803.1 shadow of prion protein [Chiloscyllium plagiosum]XP_043534804.1 shadow of prion protein [Chiloscyllium plagiosum]XP_043534805.1 shadow of prion protein [Chiloscyllium plagiosum]XP_043534806.1 shadow of prion protein [Chiloscyllium plagiosum]XP_043534807.1 shadow of prion protein [Chiloscyllium plagiosum]XP_043534808.1 shadow of prion protein [Chiloscyllium plagio